MEKHEVLDQLLMELHRFLLILDKETLSGNATVQKGLLSDLLQSYSASNGADEEYIYMNKVSVTGKDKGCIAMTDQMPRSMEKQQSMSRFHRRASPTSRPPER
ncbi:Actin filament-associated protein 1-like 2 [Liparis tanakae]|uniref:Actin filament-associated protein 1-like 2 n=1 Tax=Liparis tanakae TaxID=230148 RepID=A0A4Z2FWK4_9TELE|nr:Actin filament-associated protein 1-like 2 [Liparis tanakae]